MWIYYLWMILWMCLLFWIRFEQWRDFDLLWCLFCYFLVFYTRFRLLLMLLTIIARWWLTGNGKCWFLDPYTILAVLRRFVFLFLAVWRCSCFEDFFFFVLYMYWFCGFWNFQMWPGIIQKSKDGGLDVIETYVFWNLHEPVRNQVHFCELIDSST